VGFTRLVNDLKEVRQLDRHMTTVRRSLEKGQQAPTVVLVLVPGASDMSDVSAVVPAAPAVPIVPAAPAVTLGMYSRVRVGRYDEKSKRRHEGRAACRKTVSPHGPGSFLNRWET
jgi:hypothetical protein